MVTAISGSGNSAEVLTGDLKTVMPAKAGTQTPHLMTAVVLFETGLDPHLRGDDVGGMRIRRHSSSWPRRRPSTQPSDGAT